MAGTSPWAWRRNASAAAPSCADAASCAACRSTLRGSERRHPGEEWGGVGPGAAAELDADQPLQRLAVVGIELDRAPQGCLGCFALAEALVEERAQLGEECRG